MNIENLLTIVLGGTNIFSIIMYLGERKQRIHKTKLTEADALAEMQKVYAQYVIDFKDKYNQLEQKYQEVCKRQEKLEQMVQRFQRKCINNCAS